MALAKRLPADAANPCLLCCRNKQFGGRRRAAARVGLPRTTFMSRMRAYGICREWVKPPASPRINWRICEAELTISWTLEFFQPRAQNVRNKR